MYINAKKIAVLGLLLAIVVIMLVLSGTIEVSTLFFLAAASFCVGIAVREYGIRMGVAFFIASILLGFLLAPNKLYCFTYAVMSFYILLSELLWIWLYRFERIKNPVRVFSFLKYIVFNVLYLPVLFLFPKLIYSGVIDIKIYIFFIIGGQVGLFFFEKAYCYFQLHIWNKFRKNIQ